MTDVARAERQGFDYGRLFLGGRRDYEFCRNIVIIRRLTRLKQK